MGYKYCLGPAERSGDVIKLLKLHGSINWGQVENSKEILALPIEELLHRSEEPQYLSPQVVNIPLVMDANFAQLVKEHLRQDVAEMPVIVPPGLFKTEHRDQ